MDGTKTYLVQSRPITTLATRGGEADGVGGGRVTPLVSGLGASPGTASGPVRVLDSPQEGDRLLPGEVLVAPRSWAWTSSRPHSRRDRPERTAIPTMCRIRTEQPSPGTFASGGYHPFGPTLVT
jgi:hypothetical protein